MSHGLGRGGGGGDDDDDDDDEFSSGSEDGGASFDEDMEALRRACILTGADGDAAQAGGLDLAAPDSDSDDDDDLGLVRRLQERFSADLANPLTLKPLASIHPAAAAATSDEDEDDFETLRAIQTRFCAYDHSNTENSKNGLSSTGHMSNAMTVNILGGCKVFPDDGDTHDSNQTFNKDEHQPSAIIEGHQPAQKRQGLAKYSSFPKSGQIFINALKKNRSCQKLIRSKLIQIEARIEEIKKLKERVKILKDFQVSCRQRTGKALSQKKDPLVQLISARKTIKSSKVNDRKFSAMHYGPAENSHVSGYRMALTRFPLSFHRSKWSEVEKENLGKGIKQQFQETLLQISLDRFSASDGDQYGFEDILLSIRDLDITPESIREFLPKVNWDQLASLYILGRSGAECEARWLNWEDPLINHGKWTVEEDKHLLFFIQEKGINNWFEVAVSLGTKRTPFQCLARYQRSLNPCILKSEWTPDEDAQLRAAVEIIGENDWQAVASALEGRTGTQCSNRWKKTLHPARQRVGRWTADEDKRLRVAVKLFGPKNWMKIADFVPGRTQVQCRERWVNSLDPSLNWNPWTPEEDAMLEAAIAEHGYCWSKIAACLAPRTDNQCRRRWKVVFPHEVPLLREARKVRKAALVRNFVDRESERPALGPGDFLPLQMTSCVSDPDSLNPSTKQKTGLSVLEKVGSRRKRKANQSNAVQVSRSGYNEVGNDELAEHDSSKKTRVTKPCSRKSKHRKQAKCQISQPVSTTSVVSNGEISEVNDLSCIEQGKISPRVQKKVDLKKPQFNSGLVVKKASCKNDEIVAKHGSLLRNKKVTKLHSNEERPNGHAIDHSSCQLDPTSLVMANDENRQVQGMSDFSRKKRIVTCDQEVGNKRPRVDSQLDLEQAGEIISCNEDERVTRDNTVPKKRKSSNAHLRKDDLNECSKDQRSTQPDSSSSLMIKGKNVEAHDPANMTEKKKNIPSRAQKKLGPKKTRKDGHSHLNHVEVGGDVSAELIASKENRNYKTYRRRKRNVAPSDRCYSNSECIPALPEKLNGSQPVSIYCEKDGLEQLMTGNEPVSQQVPGTDDCNITLASLLIKKHKKNAILTSSERNGMPSDVDQMPPKVVYRGEEPNLLDPTNGNTPFGGPTREKTRNDLAFDCEDGDITLVCFLRDNSMKKRP